MTLPGDPRPFLRELFEAAVAAADPMKVIPPALPPRPEGRVVVVGAGKASARMAEAVESVWGPCEGLVVTRDGYERACEGIEIVSASHPVPDARGEAATRRMLQLLEGLGEDDLALALISGGGSSLLVAPAGEMMLEEKRAVNRALLASGAPIGAMNRLRKHLSRVKGGQLAAAAHPARMVALTISDVPGDDPADIASGPTVGETSTAEDARAIVARWAIDLPPSAQRVLGGPTGPLRPDDPRLSRAKTRVIAAPSQSLDAAAERAWAEGVEVRLLGDALEGEARELAAEHAALALREAAAMAPGAAPLLLLSGGECTVTRRGDGIGGPNAEYALALAVALDGAPNVFAVAGDTDGVDGAAEVAGALVGPDTLEKARQAGRDPRAALDTNDAHRFFEAIGDQLVTGPTLTNVNDLRAILVRPPRG
ncbi:glycerate kinase type-2 family protein [Limimaricola pyoseonensis]|uniref:Hydroxypyruvate reductase n=1 Tax=Limimaricola pyoseonensis TaxID=521013 RepID=A0A1G7CP93_9RHOB|nr:glycerate kinase [Limimaricola pyoseonensis]SDE40600.1 hydroxypyruvate reductase [Limimaricola pyoseonensis]